MEFTSYSPELIDDETGFKQSFFSQYAELEKNNFWFYSRSRLIIWALKNYFPEISNFMEIGCGNGIILSAIQQALPHLTIFGSDLSSTALKFSATHLPNVTYFQMDARAIPFTEKFDAIGAFDMLEHLAEDELVLQQIHKALKPHGSLLLTVPQHEFLWSQHDEHLCHVRRYTKQNLVDKLHTAGFEIIRTTSFISLLLPCMLISRFLNKNSDSFNCLTELKLPKIIDGLFRKVLSAERALIKKGVNFPAGGSLLLIAKKIN